MVQLSLSFHSLFIGLLASSLTWKSVSGRTFATTGFARIPPSPRSTSIDSTRIILLLHKLRGGGYELDEDLMDISKELEEKKKRDQEEKKQQQSQEESEGKELALNPFTMLAGTSKESAAWACSLFLAFNSLTLLVAPNVLLEKVYNIRPDKGRPGEVATTLMRCMSTIGLGVALTVYLSVILGLPVHTAMGWGLVPRTLIFWYLRLSDRLQELEMNTRLFSFNTLITTWCTGVLLLNQGGPEWTSRIFACLATLQGLLFVLFPARMSLASFGISLDGEAMNKSRALFRGFGNELLTSAALMGCLSFGLSPVRAAGVVSLVWAVLLFDMGFVDETWRLMDSEGPRAQVVHLLVSASLAAGFLRST